ncbi:hypothetical protein BHE74_00003236 [Ensete ventricosum]|nr:hypothetical protein BHE74_00003236 [Ensete ventricosum]
MKSRMEEKRRRRAMEGAQPAVTPQGRKGTAARSSASRRRTRPPPPPDLRFARAIHQFLRPTPSIYDPPALAPPSTLLPPPQLKKHVTQRRSIAGQKMGEVSPEMEQVFKRFDTNGDGKISLAELAEVLRTLGSTSADDVKRTMAEIDTDGDGNIDFKEFGAFCRANPGLMKDVAKVFL